MRIRRPTPAAGRCPWSCWSRRWLAAACSSFPRWPRAATTGGPRPCSLPRPDGGRCRCASATFNSAGHPRQPRRRRGHRRRRPQGPAARAGAAGDGQSRTAGRSYAEPWSPARLSLPGLRAVRRPSRRAPRSCGAHRRLALVRGFSRQVTAGDPGRAPRGGSVGAPGQGTSTACTCATGSPGATSTCSTTTRSPPCRRVGAAQHDAPASPGRSTASTCGGCRRSSSGSVARAPRSSWSATSTSATAPTGWRGRVLFPYARMREVGMRASYEATGLPRRGTHVLPQRAQPPPHRLRLLPEAARLRAARPAHHGRLPVRPPTPRRDRADLKRRG